MSATQAWSRWVVGVTTAIVAIGALPGAHGQDGDPFAAAGSDPMELARVVDRIGDDRVIALLGDETPAAVQLGAVRAATQLRAPERALEALARIAAGRDPDLAPAAAMSILEIARALDPQALDARETMRDELTPARAALAPLAADQTARADLRRIAGMAEDALAALGVPAPEG